MPSTQPKHTADSLELISETPAFVAIHNNNLLEVTQDDLEANNDSKLIQAVNVRFEIIIDLMK